MRAHFWSLLAALGALLGLAFAAFSTYDFMVHLDRQVHGIHCSFLPGLTGTDLSGSSGCHVTLMSPYSSFFRDSVWGGIPISLAAMSVFAFLLAWAVVVMAGRRAGDRAATGFLLAGSLVPVLASAIMGYIAFAELDAACKLCIGIYAASALLFVGALGAFLAARRPAAAGGGDPRVSAPLSRLALAGAFALGVVFVLVPVGTYAATAPDFGRFVGSCGELAEMQVPEGVLVDVGPQGAGVEVIEVLDPLCPACRGFERRFDELDAAAGVSRKILLFPLDDHCNWMVDSAIHPGACTISEAVLCAGDRAEEVIDWTFDHQQEIREAAAEDASTVTRMVTDHFPNLRQCVGSPAVQAKLNLALRWAVANRMPVLTPQVYVGGTRMCDEDTDLGMDFSLSRLIARAQRGGARAVTLVPPPPIPTRAIAPREGAGAGGSTTRARGETLVEAPEAGEAAVPAAPPTTFEAAPATDEGGAQPGSEGTPPVPAPATGQQPATPGPGPQPAPAAPAPAPAPQPAPPTPPPAPPATEAP